MYYSSGNYEAFATPKKPEGIENKSAYVVGTGLAGLAAACFLIRDAQMPGEHITLFEHLPVAGGSCDGIYDATKGFIMRGGREMDNHFECMWDLFKSIPSIVNPGETIFSEYYYLNKEDPNFSLCRVTEKQGQDAHTDRKYGLTPGAATQLLKLFMATNKSLEDKKIDDVFDDEFYATNFWTYWQTMFAFEKWHSALEMKLYLQRYIHHIDGLPDLSALRFTRYNQYESMILPMCKYITDHGGKVLFDTTVTNIVCDCTEDKKVAKKIEYTQGGVEKVIELTENDLVICTNGCQGDASAYGDNTHAPVVKVKNGEGPSVEMWKKLAAQDPAFGRPEKFCGDPEKSNWESATVTTLDEKILPYIEAICKRDPLSGGVVTGGIVSVKDSSWLLSWTINRQPQFRAQPEGQVCVWLYGLFTDVPGDYVKKPMRDCTGKEICEEWLYHLGVPEEQIEELAEHSANTVPCMMPYITAFFMPRADGDRPLVVPEGAVNFAFIGQFAETPRDTIFTTEYSMRTGMEAVYTLLDIDRGVPEVWGSVFDLRVLLNATVLLRDGKPATDMNMNVLEKLLLSRGLKEIEHTDIYGLLKEFGVIPTTDENRDVPVPATGAVWPGIH